MSISDQHLKVDQSPRALRQFGVTLGLALLLLGSLLLWRHHRGPAWPLISVGILLLLLAGLAPSTLKWVHRPWMLFSFALGWLVTHILLTLVFYFVVTPVGLLQRLFGKRAIEVAFKTDAASYWHPRIEHPARGDYEKQF